MRKEKKLSLKTMAKTVKYICESLKQSVLYEPETE